VAVLKGRLLSSHSEQFKKYSKSFDWLEKSRPFKKANINVLLFQTIEWRLAIQFTLYLAGH